MKKSTRTVVGLVAGLALITAACGSDDDSSSDDTAAPATEASGEDSGGDTASDGGSIWVLLPDSATSDRWETADRRFFAEAFDAAGLSEGSDYSIVNAEGDAATQISQAEQAIGDGASVILLTSNDSGSGATIIDLANEAGVQVVEYDRFNTEGSAGGAAYVSFDNVRVGATMASILEGAIDDTGASPAQVVMQNGGEEDNNAFLFRDGYNETVEARVADGSWELVADQFTPGWDNAEALSIAEQILVAAENNVNGWFAANDGIANSVIAAIESAGLDPSTIPVSGQDATTAGLQNILLGKQAMTVYKPIAAEAAVAAQIALALRAGEDVTAQTGDFTIIGIDAEGKPTADASGGVPYIALVPIAVTADNILETVIADGFTTIEEICTGDVAETDFCVENS
jgi:D-xylose transport system substrate-binding protein